MKQIAAVVVFMACLTGSALAQMVSSNYQDRRSYIVNSAPQVELSGFGFQNAYRDRGTGMRFETSMKWKNIGTQPITAFEIVILKYDAFNRRLIGERWTVTGTTSANWSPLQPGTSSGDGTIGYGEELVFTGIAYVRAVRLVDGSVWEVNPAQLLADLRKTIPGFKDFGGLEPDPKGKPDTR